MEREVVGTGARPRLHRALLGRSEPTRSAVQVEHEDTVELLVRHQHETAGAIEYDVVAFWIDEYLGRLTTTGQMVNSGSPVTIVFAGK